MTNPEHVGGSGNGSNGTNNNTSSSSYDPPAAVQDQVANANVNVVIPEAPSQRTLQLWHEVACGIDKSQTGTCD